MRKGWIAGGGDDEVRPGEKTLFTTLVTDGDIRIPPSQEEENFDLLGKKFDPSRRVAPGRANKRLGERGKKFKI